jgi:arylsulfatase A-like enzyme
MALRRGDWKLITNRKGKSPQLFNIEDDPNETTDLARDYPGRVEDLLEQLRELEKPDPQS